MSIVHGSVVPFEYLYRYIAGTPAVPLRYLTKYRSGTSRVPLLYLMITATFTVPLLEATVTVVYFFLTRTVRVYRRVYIGFKAGEVDGRRGS